MKPVTLQTATLFKNGGSQAVRLPKAFRFEGTEVFIKKVPEGVLLISKEEHAALVWQRWRENLTKYSEPFDVEIPKDEPPEEVEGLDELFS